MVSLMEKHEVQNKELRRFYVSSVCWDNEVQEVTVGQAYAQISAEFREWSVSKREY
jgi:hypothetical protein